MKVKTNSKTKKHVVILGAGFTGLVAAYYLSKEFNVTLIEKEAVVGGTAMSFKYKDFILDYGPHKLYSELPGIIDEIKKITPLLKIKKKNSIHIRGNYYDFPLKLSQILMKMPLTAIQAGMDIFFKKKYLDDSYENFLLNRFGRTLYELSFKGYAHKVWNSDPRELDSELARRRVAVSGFFELLKGVFTKDKSKMSAEYFYYPPGGIKQLLESLASEIRKNHGEIILSSKITGILVKSNKIESVHLEKKRFKPDYVISTIPLDSLSEIVTPKNENLLLAKNLRYQRLNIIYFILNKPRALKDCWIFFPGKDIIFQRIAEQKAFSPHTSPENKTALMVETTQEITPILIKKIIYQLEKSNVLKKSDILEYFVKSIDKSYPLYRKGFLNNLNPALGYLESIENFYTLGRPGLFNYNNMDQCWDMAMKLSDQIKLGKTKDDWKKTKELFSKYRIVD